MRSEHSGLDHRHIDQFLIPMRGNEALQDFLKHGVIPIPNPHEG